VEESRTIQPEPSRIETLVVENNVNNVQQNTTTHENPVVNIEENIQVENTTQPESGAGETAEVLINTGGEISEVEANSFSFIFPNLTMTTQDEVQLPTDQEGQTEAMTFFSADNVDNAIMNIDQQQQEEPPPPETENDNEEPSLRIRNDLFTNNVQDNDRMQSILTDLETKTELVSRYI
jgi:hypothetical protein